MKRDLLQKASTSREMKDLRSKFLDTRVERDQLKDRVNDLTDLLKEERRKSRDIETLLKESLDEKEEMNEETINKAMLLRSVLNSMIPDTSKTEDLESYADYVREELGTIESRLNSN